MKAILFTSQGSETLLVSYGWVDTPVVTLGWTLLLMLMLPAQ